VAVAHKDPHCTRNALTCPACVLVAVGCTRCGCCTHVLTCTVRCSISYRQPPVMNIACMAKPGTGYSAPVPMLGHIWRHSFTTLAACPRQVLSVTDKSRRHAFTLHSTSTDSHRMLSRSQLLRPPLLSPQTAHTSAWMLWAARAPHCCLPCACASALAVLSRPVLG
jgi:hypothetical protein